MNPQVSAGASTTPLAAWVPEAVEAVVGACHPQRVVLFGSVARGEERPGSDIDLLVIIDDDADTLAVICAAVGPSPGSKPRWKSSWSVPLQPTPGLGLREASSAPPCGMGRSYTPVPPDSSSALPGPSRRCVLGDP